MAFRKSARVFVICLKRRAIFQLKPLVCGLRVYSRESNDSDRDGNGPDPPVTSPSSRVSSFGKRRSLSPLERLSQMLPENGLSQEVWDLRGIRNPEVEGSSDKLDSLSDETTSQDLEAEEPPRSSDPLYVPGERSICFGELLLAEFRRKHHVEFRKMFQLKEGLKLHSNWGAISHNDIEGRRNGSIIRTSMWIPILIRRPSLEEFTLFMKRAPAITYPKDASAMLTMMDVTEGDTVLESGSGSGAMSLFLSKAVGSSGNVLSVEMREDHHRRAVLNYQCWRSAWSLRRGKEWPDNVLFHLGDLRTAGSFLDGHGFNSIALDMVNPHLALPTVVPYLHPGSVCAVYQANITQVIDLLEGLRCSGLPLVCERILDVQYRDWLVAPSVKKDGTYNRRQAPFQDDDENGNEDKDQLCQKDTSVPFGDVPYIARPHPDQTGHSAFLVKLRKILK